MKRFTYIILSVLLLAVSCIADSPPPSEIIIGQKNIVLNVGESVQIDAKLISQTDKNRLSYRITHPTISEVDQYVTINENGVLHAIKLPSDPRFTIWVSTADNKIKKTIPLTIKQNQINKIIRVNPESINASSQVETEHTIEVIKETDTPFDYEITGLPSWLQLSKSSSEGVKDRYTLKVLPNSTEVERRAEIFFGDKSLSVIQHAPSPDSPFIRLQTPSKAWEDTPLYIGSTYKVRASVYPEEADQKVEFSISNAGKGSKYMDKEVLANFLRLTPEGNLTILAKPDSFWDPRFTLTVSAPGLDSYNRIDMTFHIEEDKDAGVESVSDDFISVPSHLSYETEITVQKATCTTTLTGTSPESWIAAERIKVSPDGLEETWKIIAGENRTSAARTGNVVLKDQKNKETLIKISQPGNPSPALHTEWVYGITPPSPDEYITYPDKPYYFEIYENRDPAVNQGWYLATKSSLSYDPPSHHLPDSNLCWAYTAVNAVHWWYEHNRSYIDKFMKLNPDIANPDNPVGNPNKHAKMDFTYSKDAEYVKDKSALIKIFTQRHHDVGDNPSRAVRDLLFMPRNTGTGNSSEPPGREYPGWFNSVFGLNYTRVLESTVIYKENPDKAEYESLYQHFEDTVNSALLGKKTMMLSVHYDKVTADGAGHAINLWGVSYDEDGKIVELIIGDNNLCGSNERKNTAYLTNYAVTYADGRVNIHSTGASTIGKPMGYVRELYSLGLGTEYWRNWDQKNR